MSKPTTLPPIGSMWAPTQDPHSIVIVVKYSTVRFNSKLSEKNNIVHFHKPQTNTEWTEWTKDFLSTYKPLEQRRQHDI